MNSLGHSDNLQDFHQHVHQVLLQHLDMDAQDSTITFFIVAKKDSRFTRLNVALEELTSDKIRSKLHNWVQAHRLVALIEKGNEAYVKVGPKLADRLAQSEPVLVNDKTVKVEQYDKFTDLAEDNKIEELITAVQEAFEKIPAEPKEQATIHPTVSQRSFRTTQEEDYFQAVLSLLNKIDGNRLQGKVRKDIEQIKTLIASRIAEEQRKLAEEKREAAKIQRIKDEILRKEIVKEEIEKLGLHAELRNLEILEQSLNLKLRGAEDQEQRLNLKLEAKEGSGPAADVPPKRNLEFDPDIAKTEPKKQKI